MYFISSVNPDNTVAITDTADWVTETVTLATCKQYIQTGIKIYGASISNRHLLVSSYLTNYMKEVKSRGMFIIEAQGDVMRLALAGKLAKRSSGVFIADDKLEFIFLQHNMPNIMIMSKLKINICLLDSVDDWGKEASTSRGLYYSCHNILIDTVSSKNIAKLSRILKNIDRSSMLSQCKFLVNPAYKASVDKAKDMYISKEEYTAVCRGLNQVYHGLPLNIKESAVKCHYNEICKKYIEPVNFKLETNGVFCTYAVSTVLNEIAKLFGIYYNTYCDKDDVMGASYLFYDLKKALGMGYLYERVPILREPIKQTLVPFFEEFDKFRSLNLDLSNPLDLGNYLGGERPSIDTSISFRYTFRQGWSKVQFMNVKDTYSKYDIQAVHQLGILLKEILGIKAIDPYAWLQGVLYRYYNNRDCGYYLDDVIVESLKSSYTILRIRGIRIRIDNTARTSSII